MMTYPQIINQNANEIPHSCVTTPVHRYCQGLPVHRMQINTSSGESDVCGGYIACCGQKNPCHYPVLQAAYWISALLNGCLATTLKKTIVMCSYIVTSELGTSCDGGRKAVTWCGLKERGAGCRCTNIKTKKIDYSDIWSFNDGEDDDDYVLGSDAMYTSVSEKHTVSIFSVAV
jgi:hypothetical protein